MVAVSFGTKSHIGLMSLKHGESRGFHAAGQTAVRLSVGFCPVTTGWPWSLTTLREKLIKIGAKVMRQARAVTFQLAEVAVPRELFAANLARIGRLRAAPSPG